MKKYLFVLCVFTLLPLAQAQASGAGSALSFDGIDDHVVASSASLTLTTSLTYHFQLVATNNSGSSYGADVGFTTVTLPKPIVLTQPPTGVVGPNATLNGSVNPNGYATTAWFEWGMGSLYNQQTAPVSFGSGTASLSISAGLTGLSPSVNYHYRVVA